jgi:GntR family transcriptional regulator
MQLARFLIWEHALSAGQSRVASGILPPGKALERSAIIEVAGELERFSSPGWKPRSREAGAARMVTATKFTLTPPPNCHSVLCQSAIMLLQIDFKSGKPVYLQLVDQIRYAAASGGLRPGESLPSIRPLAEELRVNRNTIAKAYAELESQGVIETLPGKGCFLRENNTPFTKGVRQKLLLKEIDEAVVTAHHLQVDRKTFLSMIEERLDYFEHKAALSENDSPKTTPRRTE